MGSHSDAAVLALAHKLAVGAGLIHEKESLDALRQCHEPLYHGCMAAAAEYVAVVREADAKGADDGTVHDH